MINMLNTSLSSQSSVNPLVNNNSTNNKTQPAVTQNADSTDQGVTLSLSPQAQKLLKTANANNNQAGNSGANSQSPNGTNSNLTSAQLRTVQELKARDLHVKMHEQQHLAVAGAYAIGGAHYQYTKGPDGKSYATGGEVQLDASPVQNNPAATIQKAEIIRAGALAPSDPSAADYAVAASASKMEAKAEQELTQKKQKENTSGNNSQINTANKGQQSQFQAYNNSLSSTLLGLLVNQSA